MAMKALPALRPHAAKLRLRTSVRRLWGHPALQHVLQPAGTASILWLLWKTRRNTVPALSRKRRRQLLESKCPSMSVRAPPRATLLLWKLSGLGPLPSRRTWARGGATSSKGDVLSRPSPLYLQLIIPLPAGHRFTQAAQNDRHQKGNRAQEA
jgi:hypothetical protein